MLEAFEGTHRLVEKTAEERSRTVVAGQRGRKSCCQLLLESFIRCLKALCDCSKWCHYIYMTFCCLCVYTYRCCCKSVEGTEDQVKKYIYIYIYKDWLSVIS